MTDLGFQPWLHRWNLTPDGAPIVTHAARLLPVMQGGQPAMLKLADEAEERMGGLLMSWWDGQGAARVLAFEDDALLLERATGTGDLADMARNGQDDQATRILCEVATDLHRPRGKPLPPLIPVVDWFADLWPAADVHGGILTRAAETARRLLADQRDITALHGDLHHDNVLDFGPRGWLVIDPKRLVGDRTFDYANIFTNPDLADPTRPVATLPGVFERRLQIVTEAAGLERRRLLEWILAWTGLSAAWFLGDDDPLAEIDLQIAGFAAAELDR